LACQLRSRGFDCGLLGFGRRLVRLGFPGFAEFVASLEDVSFGLVEAAIDFAAFDHVAAAAAGNEILRVLLAFAGARDDEVDGHGQGIVEAGQAVESAILAAIVIALQDFYAFFQTDGLRHQGKGHEV